MAVPLEDGLDQMLIRELVMLMQQITQMEYFSLFVIIGLPQIIFSYWQKPQFFWMLTRWIMLRWKILFRFW